MFSGFMANAWIVGTLVALIAGFVGFFVVLRGSSFAAHALPLCGFPGAAAANLFGFDPLIGLIMFSGLGVFGIGILGHRQRNEVATALSLVVLLGTGSLFLSMSREYSQEVYSLLFGEILGVSTREIAQVAVIGAVVVGSVALLFRPLLLSSLSPDLAAVRGVSGRIMELAFLTILALATVIALPVVGALLVFSLMVGPPSAARFLTDRPVPAMVVSVALALATVWLAIALSYVSNWPIGFFVGTMSAVWYCFGRGWSRMRGGRRVGLSR